MIRFAIKQDISDIISLWNEAFGDSDKEICFFLDYNFVSENTLVYELNNKVVSMLFLLEGDLVLNGISYPSYYLYAACTAENSRGKGIMAKLLQNAKTVAEERNKFFICLMPGEKSLYDFYEKFGYKTVFSRKILRVKLSEFNGDNFNSFKEDLSENYLNKRMNAFRAFNRFEWDNKAIQFACKHHLLYGGNVENNCKGFSLYSCTANELFVKEFAFDYTVFNEAVKAILNKTKSDSAVIYLPSDYHTDIGEYSVVDSAMAVSVKQEYDALISGVKNAYLGLTLD